MKTPELNMENIKTIATSARKHRAIRPRHIERLIMLLIANLFNIGLAVYAILIPTQFSTHLLHLLLGNFMLYFIMYLVNKIINREKFHIITIVNLLIATVAWIAALYFFIIEIKHWEVIKYANKF